MSEMETGIAPLCDKMRDFLESLGIDVETVNEKQKAYIEFKRQQYWAEASAVQREVANDG